MNLRAIYDLFKETFHEWSEDKVPRLGAALAYYSIFSISPLVVLSIALARLVFQKEAEGAIATQIGATMGRPVGEAVEQMIRNGSDPGTTILATVLSLVMLLFGASGVFGQLQDSLNTIWKVIPKPGRGILGMVKDRLLSFAMVLGTGFLLLITLLLSAVLSALDHFLTPEALPGTVYLWLVVNWLVSLAVVTLLFAMIYKVLPDVKIAWRDVWVGAVVTALLFTLGKSLLALYLGRNGVTSAYGAAGSLVLVLLWVYYSSQILLFGAEFTRVYAVRRGKRVVPADNAVPITPEALARQGMAPKQAVGSR